MTRITITPTDYHQLTKEAQDQINDALADANIDVDLIKEATIDTETGFISIELLTVNKPLAEAIAKALPQG